MADPAVTSTSGTPGQESALGQNAPIEIDETLIDDDGDSAVGSQISRFTESLSSSVVDYPFAHGRRYHKFRSGAYPFPNDELELNRLDMAHELIVIGTGGKHYFAPVEHDKLHRILDLGTGTGIWAITVADEIPSAEVIGNDLSAIQPTWVPPNVRFEVDDIESPWVYPEKFDWIFCRYLTACILDWPKLVANVFENLNPGGWAEFQDFNLEFYSEDGSLTPSHTTKQWLKALVEASKITGREMNPGPLLEGWVRDAGFKNVHHQRFKFPLGPWPKDDKYKEIGLYNLAQFEQGLEGFSFGLLVGVLGWTRQEVEQILVGVRRDVRNPALHMQFDYHVVYGQKLD